MTPSELKYNVERTGSYHFTHKTMQFFGDTMRNYGCRSDTIIKDGETIQVWELYRKHPVKHNLWSSAYFRKDNFEGVHV
jgi:hypothetical protein